MPLHASSADKAAMSFSGWQLMEVTVPPRGWLEGSTPPEHCIYHYVFYNHVSYSSYTRFHVCQCREAPEMSAPFPCRPLHLPFWSLYLTVPQMTFLSATSEWIARRWQGTRMDIFARWLHLSSPHNQYTYATPIGPSHASSPLYVMKRALLYAQLQ